MTLYIVIFAAVFFLIAKKKGWISSGKNRSARTDGTNGGVSQDRLDRIRRATNGIDESDLLQPVGADGAAAGQSPELGNAAFAVQQAATASTVTESISVILRRQVPLRHAEPPRSWLGGLPMMPADVEWPRGKNPEKRDAVPEPLHFIAQIACADLPPEIWGGVGPRTGWLLYFANNNTSQNDNPETYRVLHIAELGEERPVPADTGPVHDGIYTGSQFRHYLDQSDVPTKWRRWPVDLVTMPNVLQHDGQRSFGAPEGLAQTLYPGEDINDGNVYSLKIEPFSWRSVDYGWRGLMQAVTAEPNVDGERNRARMADEFVTRGGPASVLEVIDTKEREFDESVTGKYLQADPETLDEAMRERLPGIRDYKAARLAKRETLAVLVSQYPTAEAMLEFLAAEKAKLDTWRTGASARLTDFAGQLAAIAPDTALDSADWHDIWQMLEVDNITVWQLAYLGGRSLTIEPKTSSLWDFFHHRAIASAREVAADYYVDAAKAPLIPAAVLAVIEPYWRSLYDNRPHRIGGYHDGVQSDAAEGPTTQPLLLQLAADMSMQWSWGDNGAIYYFAKVDKLADGNFGDVECYLECH
jgi:uncharacterized protein YwqG